MPTQRPRRKVTLDDELWLALSELAERNRTNASEEIRQAIIAHLEANGWEIEVEDSKHLRRPLRAVASGSA